VEHRKVELWKCGTPNVEAEQGNKAAMAGPPDAAHYGVRTVDDSSPPAQASIQLETAA
jgi:hypothetical protein